MKKGFTLIELLVVVLIIGILAAIALPKYMVAVEKTRLAGYLPLLKSLSDAQSRYYMASGSYAVNFEDLDIDLPSNCTGRSCIIKGTDFLRLNDSGSGYGIYRNVKALDTTALTLLIHFEEDATFKKNAILCHDRGNTEFRKICQALGGQDPAPHTGGYVWLIK